MLYVAIIVGFYQCSSCILPVSAVTRTSGCKTEAWAKEIFKREMLSRFWVRRSIKRADLQHIGKMKAWSVCCGYPHTMEKKCRRYSFWNTLKTHKPLPGYDFLLAKNCLLSWSWHLVVDPVPHSWSQARKYCSVSLHIQRVTEQLYHPKFWTDYNSLREQKWLHGK